MSVERPRTDAHDAELRLEYTDPVTHARGYAVIDSLASVAYAGVRVAPRLGPEMFVMLARQRTLRYQLARVSMAGGQVGLEYDPAAPDFPEVLGRFLTALRPLLESNLSLGPDANISADLLDEVLANAELPWRMSAMQRRQGWAVERWQRYQELVTSSVGGQDPLKELQTAWSVATAAHAAADQLFQRELTVAVIGAGPFGIRIARCLDRMGAKVVALGDTSAAIHAKHGLRRELLESGDVIGAEVADSVYITGDELFGLPVDVVIAASNDDMIAVENVGRLRCGLVVEAAAHAVSSNGETVLIARGIPVLPSFAATVGPVFLTEAVLRSQVDSVDGALAHLSTSVQTTARELVRLSATLRISLREAGVRLGFHHRFGKQPMRQLSRRMRTVTDDGSTT